MMNDNPRIKLFSFQHLTWPMRTVTVLIFLQAAGLFALAGNRLARLEWDANSEPEVIIELFLNALANSAVFAVLAVLALLAMFRFWGMGPTGWGLVMLVQGLTLALALVHYSYTDAWYVFGLMLYGIIMVFYLYHPDVYEPFHVETAVDGLGEGS